MHTLLSPPAEASALSAANETHQLDCAKEVLPDPGDFRGMVGISLPMQKVFTEIRLFGRSPEPVLISGATGTGKELIARALHDESDRASGPYVAFNCTEVSPTLIERELFGHTKGAFTGADRAGRGLFEAAHRGTIFIDEIGELPLSLQTKLLRVVELHLVRRLGSTEVIHLDLRIITATHRNLRAMVTAGLFRKDLFHRLNQLELQVPRLIDRPGDLPRVAHHFLAHRPNCPRPVTLTAAALARLQAHPFDGNVRELRAVLTKAVVLHPGATVLDVGDLVLEVDEPSAGAPKAEVASVAPTTMVEGPEWLYLPGRTRAEADLEVLRRGLQRHGGNMSAAARELDINRATLRGLNEPAEPAER